MKFELPKIYPITDVYLTRLSHLEQVEKLVEGGAEMIQLRDKRAAPRDFYEAARAVMNFARAMRVKIIVNDRADIALAVRADGVHLGQNDLPPAEARKILGARAVIGFSTHSPEEAAAAAARLPIDYVAVGAVFPTASKENPEAIVGTEGVAEARTAIGAMPLVAIGGIAPDNARRVLASGANSLAVIGSILRPADRIAENLRRFREMLD